MKQYKRKFALFPGRRVQEKRKSSSTETATFTIRDPGATPVQKSSKT